MAAHLAQQAAPFLLKVGWHRQLLGTVLCPLNPVLLPIVAYPAEEAEIKAHLLDFLHPQRMRQSTQLRQCFLVCFIGLKVGIVAGHRHNDHNGVHLFQVAQDITESHVAHPVVGHHRFRHIRDNKIQLGTFNFAHQRQKVTILFDTAALQNFPNGGILVHKLLECAYLFRLQGGIGQREVDLLLAGGEEHGVGQVVVGGHVARVGDCAGLLTQRRLQILVHGVQQLATKDVAKALLIGLHLFREPFVVGLDGWHLDERRLFGGGLTAGRRSWARRRDDDRDCGGPGRLEN